VEDMARVARPILSRAKPEYCLLLAANDRWNLCLDTPPAQPRSCHRERRNSANKAFFLMTGSEGDISQPTAVL
jgi:hypothetical protein